ncbi:MAG: ATP-dependent helicase [Desulfocapsaceae bacterium]|nr:ATP-dependent helicase [Desulfocapsaceae bacterium]
MRTDILSNPHGTLPAGVNLEQLNESQYAAVTTIDGPVLVIAGAGSGKTRTLVHRVAYLMDHGVAPENILLLTFTRKSAQEMLWRAGRLLNDTCQRVVGGTFHGIANMLLRRYGGSLGYGSSFTIIDRADAEGIVNLLKSSLGLGGKGRQFPSRRIIVNMISGAVNKSMPLDDLVQEQYSHLTEYLDDILNLQSHYGEFKRNHGLMDYDDLLTNWKRLLREVPEARAAISSRFSHIMVDEYQDTNLVQADIIRLAASTHDNVMAVGDDSQSIYSFRGADFYNIMRFPKIFPNTQIIKLEENYRSSQPILTLTNDIIRNATDKYTKTLFTRIEGDLKPMLFAAADERQEARFVAATIRQLYQEGTPLEEIAVLFRSGFHSFKLELELAAGGLDFEKRGGLKLTESAHIKDVLSFLRILINPRDNLSWNRILLQLEKIGPKTAQKITAAIARSDEPFVTLAGYPAGAAWKKGLAGLAELFESLQGQDSPVVLFDRVMQYYEPLFLVLYADDYPKRKKDLDQLKGIIATYESLQTFIDDTALDPPETETGADPVDRRRLVLSTIHSAKGLEWEAVFVIGLAEGRFPHPSAEQGGQWEEERRLLYVAATRAKKRLYLCYPQDMMMPDRSFHRVGMSPFLRELRPGLYERIEAERSTSEPGPAVAGTPVTVRRTAKITLEDLSRGSTVLHPFFGEGRVTRLVRPCSVDIAFDKHGLKTLHLDYAKLKVLKR